MLASRRSERSDRMRLTHGTVIVPLCMIELRKTNMAIPKGIEVDRRVGIAMSVLSPSERSAVDRVIESPRSFTEAADRPGQVRVLHASGQPLYLMRVSRSLRLVYTFVGETAYVLDLVEQATLDHFALGEVSTVASGRERKKTKPKSGSRKLADVVEK
jgi:hypothetical protein